MSHHCTHYIIVLNYLGYILPVLIHLLTYSPHIHDTGTLCLCDPFMNKQYATPTPMSMLWNFPIIIVN